MLKALKKQDSKQIWNYQKALFIIYCEGSRRELEYFKYFKEISSRISLKVIKADSQGNNSPLGLYEHACSDIDGDGSGSLVKYELWGGSCLIFH
ncbi:MAG: hypothetical protein ACQ5SW_01735 [Sphaerochaetaceae bacterium]